MNPIIQLLVTLLELYSLGLIISIILSLLIHFKVVNRGHPIVYKIDYALNKLYEKPLNYIRRYMPDLGGIDISPILLLVAIGFVQNLLAYYF